MRAARSNIFSTHLRGRCIVRRLRHLADYKAIGVLCSCLGDLSTLPTSGGGDAVWSVEPRGAAARRRTDATAVVVADPTLLLGLAGHEDCLVVIEFGCCNERWYGGKRGGARQSCELAGHFSRPRPRGLLWRLRTDGHHHRGRAGIGRRSHTVISERARLTGRLSSSKQSVRSSHRA